MMPYLCPVDQTLFGGLDAPKEERGNCYPACLASMLSLRLEDIPHFYGVATKTPDGLDVTVNDDWPQIMAWAHSQGWSVLSWPWRDLNDFMHGSLKGALVIVSGKSPRFASCEHAVVGRLTGDGGWELVHDPHPSRDGLDGTPTSVEVWMPHIGTK